MYSGFKLINKLSAIYYVTQSLIAINILNCITLNLCSRPDEFTVPTTHIKSATALCKGKLSAVNCFIIEYTCVFHAIAIIQYI